MLTEGKRQFTGGAMAMSIDKLQDAYEALRGLFRENMTNGYGRDVVEIQDAVVGALHKLDALRRELTQKES